MLIRIIKIGLLILKVGGFIMAFSDYIGLIVPGLKAIKAFFAELERAKDEDGQISVSEFLGAVAIFVEVIQPAIEPMISEDKK